MDSKSPWSPTPTWLLYCPNCHMDWKSPHKSQTDAWSFDLLIQYCLAEDMMELEYTLKILFTLELSGTMFTIREWMVWCHYMWKLLYPVHSDMDELVYWIWHCILHCYVVTTHRFDTHSYGWRVGNLYLVMSCDNQEQNVNSVIWWLSAFVVPIGKMSQISRQSTSIHSNHFSHNADKHFILFCIHISNFKITTTKSSQAPKKKQVCLHFICATLIFNIVQ